MKKKHFRPTLR